MAAETAVAAVNALVRLRKAFKDVQANRERYSALEAELERLEPLLKRLADDHTAPNADRTLARACVVLGEGVELVEAFQLPSSGSKLLSTGKKLWRRQKDADDLTEFNAKLNTLRNELQLQLTDHVRQVGLQMQAQQMETQRTAEAIRRETVGIRRETVGIRTELAGLRGQGGAHLLAGAPRAAPVLGACRGCWRRALHPSQSAR